ncbi:MAG: Asp-tRNA(Asn)/Glu-tRNA(Gln) amidotransferase subunit GatB [Candidatus Pacebacteria bacterium]|nr:Asp-tRNA(Asn)/Glu-tRNA(Gln) amidotransferase subunit GatB [Candidatus Paceibacterota bacterium]
MEYKPTIGLEIHAELETQTKMFSRSCNDSEESSPNVNITPVDLAHPGTLPVVNKEAVKKVIMVGVALEGEIADFTEFDRKNYFYPDIPKGYQISQYKYPLVSGGKIAGVKLTRIHLEEDTGTSQHKDDYSLVNYNRAGVPLMELVTEPVITSSEEASKFAKEFQLLLQYLGVSKANMEKGEMRLEANISVSSDDKFGTKVEVKNLNSFRSLEKAIDFEIKRQIALLENGEKVVQETRGWHDEKQVTFSQRNKEYAEDYRYFPDPDIPKLKISEIADFNIKELPELPWQRRERYQKYELGNDQVEMLVSDMSLGEYFDGEVKNAPLEEVKIISNYITSDLVGLGGFGKVSTGNLKDLAKLVTSGTLSSRGAKDTLKILYEEGGDTEKVAQKNNLIQQSDEGPLLEIVNKILSENNSVVEEYKNGKESSLQFLIGQGMKETKGSANPQVLAKLIKELIGA